MWHVHGLCNVDDGGSILDDNERQTWSKPIMVHRKYLTQYLIWVNFEGSVSHPGQMIGLWAQTFGIMAAIL